MTFIKKILPPPRWQFPVIVLTGILTGLLFYILYISNAVSYMSDKPETCINCHIMIPQYATWQNSSHGRFTTCNDCHVPQDNFIRKYLFKASDGLRHATIFTLRAEPQVIRIKDAGKMAVQENCVRCHSNVIHPVSLRAMGADPIHENGERFCWDCHREVPHGRVNSLSSTPYARVPGLNKAVPDWIDNYLNNKKDGEK